MRRVILLVRKLCERVQFEQMCVVLGACSVVSELDTMWCGMTVLSAGHHVNRAAEDWLNIPKEDEATRALPPQSLYSVTDK